MADPTPQPPSQPQPPKGIDELRKGSDPTGRAQPAGGEGDGPTPGTPAAPAPRPGVDLAGVPDQPLGAAAGPTRSAVPGDGSGGGRPRDPRQKPGAASAAQPAQSRDNPPPPVTSDHPTPVDTDAVGEPLLENWLADRPDDDDRQRPRLRDLREPDDELGEDESEPDAGDEGQAETPDQEAEQSGEQPTGEMESGAGEAGEVEGAEGLSAGGEAAAAGGAEAGGTAVAEGAAEAAVAAGGASPAGWIAIAIALFLVILGLIFFLVIPGMSGGGNSASGNPTGGNATAAPGGGTVSGDVKQLTQQILAAINGKNPGHDISQPYKSSTGDTIKVLTDVANGSKFYTTCSDGSTPGPPGTKVDINPNILKFVLEASTKTHVGINAITDKCHMAGSAHYKGEAIDLDLTSGPLSILEPIARKYGGTKNYETSHHHFDFPK